jgi:hypothetical protein
MSSLWQEESTSTLTKFSIRTLQKSKNHPDGMDNFITMTIAEGSGMSQLQFN